MINKELLSKVLDESVLEISLDSSEEYVIYHTQPHRPQSINIYKLAFMIKEWANNLSYPIESIKNEARVNPHYEDAGYDISYSYECLADNEIEAIFEAGEWVLNKIKGS